MTWPSYAAGLASVRGAAMSSDAPRTARLTEPEAASDAVRTDRTRHDGGSEPAPVSDRGPYPRLEPGVFEAECVKAETYRDRQFARWSCALEFSLLDDGTRVFCFLNLGRAAKPHAGPRSEYRRAWIIATGGQPRRRQVLSDRVFEGKIFEVRVANVEKRFDGREHPKGAVYSVVREIVRRTYP